MEINSMLLYGYQKYLVKLLYEDILRNDTFSDISEISSDFSSSSPFQSIKKCTICNGYRYSLCS